MSMNISEISRALIYDVEPFYAHLSLGIDKLFSQEVPTACATIRGINPEILFNEEYCSKFDEKYQISIMQHELMHICMHHLTSCLDYSDSALFNIAADMCINQYIPKERVHETWITLDSFPGLDNIPPFKDTDFYYNYLKDNKGKSDKLQQMVDYMNGGGDTVASHPLWGIDPETGEEMSDIIANFVKNQVEYQIKEVFENSCNKNAGSVPGYLRDFINSLYIKNPPTLDWKQVVRQFNSLSFKTKIKRTRRKPNIRFPDNAAINIKRKNKILVAVDTSGSIQNSDLELFFEQIFHIYKTGTAVDIIECDTQIGRIYSFDPKKQTQITGGGGTYFAPVIKYLNKSIEHNGLIYLTDGFPGDSEDVARTRKPVLWIVTPDGTTDFNFSGRKVKMSC